MGQEGGALLWQLNMGEPEGSALPPLPTAGEGASKREGGVALKVPSPRGSVREGAAMLEGGV